MKRALSIAACAAPAERWNGLVAHLYFAAKTSNRSILRWVWMRIPVNPSQCGDLSRRDGRVSGIHILTPVSFDQIADKALAIAVLCLLFDRQVRAAILLAVGLPLTVALWLTRRYRALRDRLQGNPWRIYD